MKRMMIAGACVAIALMVAIAGLQTASPASAAVPAAAQSLGFQTLLEASFPAPVASPLTREAAALTRRGSPPPGPEKRSPSRVKSLR